LLIEARFGGAVAGEEGLPFRGDRGDVHHCSGASIGDQSSSDRLATREGVSKVGREQMIEGLDGVVVQSVPVRHRDPADDVDDEVDLGVVLDRRTERFEVVDIDDTRCALLSSLFDLGLGGLEICAHGTQGNDVGAGVGEPVTHRGTDAATTSAHDEGSAAGEGDLDRHVCIVAHDAPDFDLARRTGVRVRCGDGLHRRPRNRTLPTLSGDASRRS
jgi:hypothetical protein